MRTGPKQLPWHQPRLRFPAVAAVSADELEAIHDASLTILEEIGMDVLLPEARALLKAAGAEVEADGQRVRMARELVLERGVDLPGQLPSARPQPRPRRHARRRPDRLLARQQRAQLLGPRPRPAARQPGGLPQLPEADPAAQHDAPDRRLPGRAGRRPSQPAPPGMHPRLHHADRQGLPRLFAGLGPDPRRDRDRPGSAAASTASSCCASRRC